LKENPRKKGKANRWGCLKRDVWERTPLICEGKKRAHGVPDRPKERKRKKPLLIRGKQKDKKGLTTIETLVSRRCSQGLPLPIRTIKKTIRGKTVLACPGKGKGPPQVFQAEKKKKKDAHAHVQIERGDGKLKRMLEEQRKGTPLEGKGGTRKNRIVERKGFGEKGEV